jgi:hypothetical protein
MKTAIQVLDAFENIRRAQRAGVYAPHKPLLILLALARVQRGEPRQVEFAGIDAPLKQLLTEFGPSGAAKSRHYPFWHLATDGRGMLWDLSGPREILKRNAGATPSLGELREHHIKAGFPSDIDDALRHIPGLIQAVASRTLETYFPSTIHGDIVATLGLDLDGANDLREHATAASDIRLQGWKPHTSNGTMSAGQTSNPMAYRCARCITSFSIWALSPWSLHSIASYSASTQSAEVEACRVNCSFMGVRYKRHSTPACCLRPSFWPGTPNGFSRPLHGQWCRTQLHPAQFAEFPEQPRR